MTGTQYAAIISGIANLAQSLDSAGVKDFDLATADLVSQLTPTLPVKDDGTAYTDDELTAAAISARAPFDAVIARDSQ